FERVYGQLFGVFLRSERLTGNKVFRDDRLRTNEVVELILGHFLIADVDHPLFELLCAGLNKDLGSSFTFVDQLLELSLGVGYRELLRNFGDLAVEACLIPRRRRAFSARMVVDEGELGSFELLHSNLTRGLGHRGAGT